MKKITFSLGIMLVLCLSLILSAEKSLAASQRVRVTLPNFTVTLNGNQVDNQFRQYPFLVYRDITYFPMTWYDCRLLGLDNQWSAENGLVVTQGSVASSYASYITSDQNPASDYATIPAFKITVNGNVIDNSQEEYPLLTYRNVTYFPLTWKFAHDDFGWDYVWDDAQGLSINSHNPQVKNIDLPDDAGKIGVAVFHGYYYYVETVGNSSNVYRTPEDNVADKELVYAYDLGTTNGFNNCHFMAFQIRDNRLWFTYHVGGAMMGSDIYCRVNDDGKATVEHQGYLDFKSTANGVISVNQGVPPGGNNLWFVPTGEEDKNGQSVGDPNLIYGWHTVVDASGQGYSPDFSTSVIGDYVYVLASPFPLQSGQLNGIYKINLSTNETKPVVGFGIGSFKIMDNKLYYVKDADQYLYSANLDGTDEVKLSSNKLAATNDWYGEINGNVYYTAEQADNQCYLYRAGLSQQDTLVSNNSIDSVQLVNNQIICKLVAGENYGVMVFSPSGDLNLAITDQAAKIFAYDGKILLVSAKDGSIKLITLSGND